MPQFEIPIGSSGMINTVIHFVCPNCQNQREVNWSLGPRWKCECGTWYYADGAGRIWTSDKHTNVAPPEEEVNGESDATH